jgi:hypothetical protein
MHEIWGKNKLQKLQNTLRLKQIIRKILNKSINVEDIENIITVSKYDLWDLMILSSFNNLKNIHLISDGNSSIYTRLSHLNIPFYLRALGIKNYYKLFPEVYFSPQSLPDKSFLISPQSLDPDIYNNVISLFENDTEIIKWLNDSFNNNLQKSKSLLLLTPLKLKHLDYTTSFNYFCKIIDHELKNSNNYILLKHHPRENKDNLIRFKEEITEIYGDKVLFFDHEHYFSNLPIELFFRNLNIKKLIGAISSGAQQLSGIPMTFYNSDILPKRFQDIVIFSAKFRNAKIIYV